MKLNKLLALGVVLASGLTLTSCNKAESVEAGIGYSVTFDAAKGQADVTVAFAGFDAEGKITDARIDVVQVTVKPGEDGTWTQSGTKTNDNGIISKLELGKDYNMVTYGNAIAEVDAQIEAFADWTVGQTIEELKANVAASHGYGVAPHADLASSVTIVCHEFVSALEKAYELRNEAIEVSSKAQAGVGIATSLSSKDGYGELTVFASGALMDGETIQAAAIDEIVIQVEQVVAEESTSYQIKESKYYAEGKVLSKETLKEAYGMAGRATLGEWYVQVANLEKYAAGKTIAQLLAQVGENNKPAEGSELAGATSMTVNGYLAALEEAANYASLEHVGPQA